MIDHSKILTLLTVLITLALVFYHVSSLLFFDNNDLSTLYKIAQFLIIGLFTFLTIYSNFLAKLILGKDYLSGKYLGVSSHYVSTTPETEVNRVDVDCQIKKDSDLDNNESKSENIDQSLGREQRTAKIKFTITQSIFETTITGKSVEYESGVPMANWHGKLFKHEHNILYFALELHSRMSEFGILQLHIDGDDVNGFYYSGAAKSRFTFAITASKET